MKITVTCSPYTLLKFAGGTTRPLRVQFLFLNTVMYAARRHQAAESKVFYEVPTLSNTTLLRCLREIQLPFTEEDLMRPTAPSTQYLFERCLDLLMGVHTTQIEEVRDKMLQNVEHPVSVILIVLCINAIAN